jgi:hypothetical protein
LPTLLTVSAIGVYKQNYCGLLRRRKVSECKEHGAIYVEYGGNIGAPSDGYCYQCEIDRLKAGLKRSELSRATLSGLYHDLQCQLAEVKHELKTTQLYLMEEETTRKIWEQDCKKAESQLAKISNWIGEMLVR